MNIWKISVGFATASVIATSVFAHGGATGIVKDRMDGMGVMKESMKVLTPMMQGKTPYDAAVVRREADKIGAHAGEALTKLFPEGSNHKPSEAKPEIWTDWDHFARLAAQLQLFSQGLSQASENDLMVSQAPSKNMASGSMMGAGSMMGSGGSMGSGMMSAGMMSGSTITAGTLATMPPDGVFTMLGQTCSACHTRFRAE